MVIFEGKISLKSELIVELKSRLIHYKRRKNLKYNTSHRH